MKVWSETPQKTGRTLHTVLSSVSKNLENLLKLEVWLIMKAVSFLKTFHQREEGAHCGRYHDSGSWTVLGVLDGQRHAVKAVTWPAPGIERFSSSRSHPEETKGRGRKTNHSQILQKYQWWVVNWTKCNS